MSEKINCGIRKKITCIHSSLVVVTAILAITIGCYSLKIIEENNNDINLAGSQRAYILKFEKHCSSILFATHNEYVKIKTIILPRVINKLLNVQSEIDKKYNVNTHTMTKIKELVNIKYPKLLNLTETYYHNISENATKQDMDVFRSQNFNEISNLLTWYRINIRETITKSLYPILHANVDIIVSESTYNSHLIVYIAIGLGIIQLIGIIITGIMEYLYGDADYKLIKVNTEKDIQTKLVSMLSHDLKGSATNIVGEIELIQENYHNMYRHNLNETCHMCSKNFDSLKTMNQNLERGMFEAIHIQYCIKTLQLKSDILHNKYVHKTSKFKLYEIFKIFQYKFSDNIIFNFPQNIMIETNQDILYNILQNAFKNSMKHGKKNGIIRINVLECINNLEIIIINDAGDNQDKMLSYQEQYGKNWIFDNTYDLKKMDIGKKESTFKGLIDMKILANAIYGDVSINFDNEKTYFSLKFDKVQDAIIDISNNPLDNSDKSLTESVINIQGIQTPLKSIEQEIPGTIIEESDDKLYLLGADDQAISRIFLLKLGIDLDIDIAEPTYDTKKMKTLYRDEKYLKIFGKEPSDFEESKLIEIAKEWKNKKAILILDQNIDFTSEVILGTDISKLFRSYGFKGIILMRSGNDCNDDIEFYKKNGADGIISKIIKKNESVEIIKNIWIPELNNRTF